MHKIISMVMLGALCIAGSARAEDKKENTLDMKHFPATAKMLSLCEAHVLAQAEEGGVVPDEAKKARVEAFAKEYEAFAEAKLTAEQKEQIDKSQAIFQSYYERDLSKLKHQKKPYTVAQVEKMCVKHAKGAGKTFDAAWMQAMEKEATEAPVQVASVQLHERPKVAPHAKAKVLEGLNKTVTLIDQAIGNKYTTEEEKVKLMARKETVAKDIARWEAMETTGDVPTQTTAVP